MEFGTPEKRESGELVQQHLFLCTPASASTGNSAIYPPEEGRSIPIHLQTVVLSCANRIAATLPSPRGLVLTVHVLKGKTELTFFS